MGEGFGQVVTEFTQILTHSKEPLNSGFVSWGCIAVIAVTLAELGSTPLSVSLCPMKVTEDDLNWCFFAERRRSY